MKKNFSKKKTAAKGGKEGIWAMLVSFAVVWFVGKGILTPEQAEGAEVAIVENQDTLLALLAGANGLAHGGLASVRNLFKHGFGED